MAKFDVIVVTDPRFSGGTAAALIADIDAFQALDLRVGLFLVSSSFFDQGADKPNDAVLSLPMRDGVELVEAGASVACEVAFFHHPLAFNFDIAESAQIDTKKAVIVAHHPCFRGDGSLEYNPVSVSNRVRRQFKVQPLWAPVSGLVRQQLRSFCPLIGMTQQDWNNIFDVEYWRADEPAFSGTNPVVGRHSRPDTLKWPSRAEDLAKSLAAGPDWTVRIMGWPDGGFDFDVPNSDTWDILSFNQVPVRDFLSSIDVFAYHFSDLWVEAFGRTVTEAILMERPCLLDPRLEQTFGDLATYCRPDEVEDHLRRLRENPQVARARAKTARDGIVEIVGASAMGRRYAAIRADSGTYARTGAKTASPLVTLRKSLGLMRRARM